MKNSALPKSRYALFLVIMIAGLSLDLASKSWVFDDLGMPRLNQQPIWIWQGVLSFETSLNEGALFGMGQGWGWAFIGLSLVAVAGIVYWLLWQGAASDWLLCSVMAGISAGIVGNLYDRLGLHGLTWTATLKSQQSGLIGTQVYAVRDFIHFQYGAYSWPTFNVADSLLVCGVAILIFHAYVIEPRQAANATRDSDSSTDDSKLVETLA